jgi:hypothetical protein
MVGRDGCSTRQMLPRPDQVSLAPSVKSQIYPPLHGFRVAVYQSPQSRDTFSVSSALQVQSCEVDLKCDQVGIQRHGTLICVDSLRHSSQLPKRISVSTEPGCRRDVSHR